MLAIVAYISHCLECAQTKDNTHTTPGFEYPTPDCPFGTVVIDILILPRSSIDSAYVRVIVDQFSRFVIIAPLTNKFIPLVPHALVTDLLCPYTTPIVLENDNGKELQK